VGLALACRVATTFKASGEIDEESQRQYLQRFIDTKVEVYLGSAGSGEGNALSWEELRQLYRIGVDHCKGKVLVQSNSPEQHTVRGTLEHTRLAIECGIEVVNIYGPAGWHGYKPTEDEYSSFYSEVLKEIKHPVAVAPYPNIGYTPKPEWVADVCNRHKQVVAVNLAGLDENYFINLKAVLRRDVALYVPLRGSLNTFTLGAAGLVGGEINLTPQTFRRYAELYETGKFDELGEVFSDLMRINQYNKPWGHINARVVKMFMHVLKLPGWRGGLRKPLRMPSEQVMEGFEKGLLALRVPEIEQMAKAANLSATF
jgi:dihydrodipicolinate synthase/N-acetylneuraminate lyase